MDNSNMKNMIVLKDLPSNIVEEAIVILKSSKEAKRLEKVDKIQKMQSNINKNKDKNYILKEAEMLVNGYIAKIENKQQENYKKNDRKSKNLKKYNLIITIIAIVEFIGLIIS